MYIAQDSPSAAKRWLDGIQRRLRMLPFGNYLILYEQAADGAQIVRVMYGARQWQELL